MTRPRRPAKQEVPAPLVRDFRALLDAALTEVDAHGRAWADAKWGVYAFYDYDGEPIYVGQTNEQLRVRIRRHLTNQRTDAVAMRILDVFEVAEMQLWPLWELESAPVDPEWGADSGFEPGAEPGPDSGLEPGAEPVATRRADSGVAQASAKQALNALEYTVYLDAIQASRFGAILNEAIPPVSERVVPPPSRRFALVSGGTRAERGHPDTRIARRAETISRLAAVAHERGLVSDGLRRVLVVQAVRLAYLAATRLAAVEGRPEPDPALIDVAALVGNVLQESDLTLDFDVD